jgi:hypothetical protein
VSEKTKLSTKLPDLKTFVGRDAGEKNPQDTIDLEEWLAKVC